MSTFQMTLLWAVSVAVCLCSPLHAERLCRFETAVLSEEFFSEGACVTDIDGDEHLDVVSGPYWYAGPDFRRRQAYAPAAPLSIRGYSTYFFSFAADFNADGRTDILAVGMPGQAAYWFENPGIESLRSAGTKGVLWKKHLAHGQVGNESPLLIDLTGDGVAELVCCSGGAFGYAKPNADAPTAPWQWVPITEDRGFGAFTHGLGVGDVNGDGRLDLLETHGWWEQPSTLGALFQFHPVRFAEAGGAQMFAYDFDGDGDNDVISTQNAHAYGLSWFEQKRAGDAIEFTEHEILTASPGDNAWGLAISQMHAVALADIDGDGIQDIVTGKRYWAHGGGDPGAHQLPVLYWFRTVRGDDGVTFEPWLIDRRVGVGTQLTVADLQGDGTPDIIVGNKLGTFVLENRVSEVNTAVYEASRPLKRDRRAHLAGTSLFASHVRDSDPLSPEDELKSFVLPPGFEMQLVAAEPDIAKPLNLAVDARGRLWVTNTLEYPYAAPPDRKARDSIKVLEDTDGDGRADVITTFADDLNIPIGLYPYRDGVICFSIPFIWFLRDTDGDGRCDQRRKLYGPVGTDRDTHGMCNAFTRGLDGWLYACHGFNNRTTVAGSDGHEIHMQSGNTFRMRLDGSRVEHYTRGQVNPFGMTFDDFGDFLSADCHSKPITLLLEGGQYEHFGAPHDGVGFVPDVMEHLHNSTAICGIALGSATDFPEVYRDSVFSGNVATARINRNRLLRNGGSLRAQEESDFLYSDDPWFRPVDLTVGPDGSMYVADFYNRIIGHYEVDLKHPGRDRHRGRIWRIVRSESRARRDAVGPVKLGRADVAVAELEGPVDLLAALPVAQAPRRNLIVERLVDHFGAAAVAPTRAAVRHRSSVLRWHALYVLQQLDALREEELAALLEDPSPVVRVHALRVLADTDKFAARSEAWVRRGLQDAEALVRRAAALAAMKRPAASLASVVLSRLGVEPQEDVHLRHALRLALHAHLRDEASFVAVTGRELSAAEALVVAELCLALKTETAGKFLARHLDPLLKAQPERFGEYVRFAARFVSAATVGDVVRLIRERFAGNLEEQQRLLDEVDSGLEQRGVETPTVVRDWALALAEQFGAVAAASRDEAENPLSWTYNPLAGQSERQENPWVLSRSRRSADGAERVLLYSSFPRGESRTGVYRSSSFVLPARLGFFVAGHDGFPDKPLQGNNRVRLRDSLSHQVLRDCPPPRNDVAQPVEWTFTPSELSASGVPRQVYVELVDGDTAGAFAWMAVGRFSEKRLNPSTLPQRRRHAAALVERFGLSELHPLLVRQLSVHANDPETAVALARALAASTSDARWRALAECGAVAGLGAKVRGRWVNAWTAVGGERVTALLPEAMRVASALEQRRIAEILASGGRGASALLDMVEAGQASAQLLLRSTIAVRLKASLSNLEGERLGRLVADLPDEEETVVETMATHIAAFRDRGGKFDSGKALFQKHCASCHQLAGEGANIGPNLDGVGSRGVERLVEDIVAPHRNVDVAFRTTTVVTKDGTVLAGLFRRIEGAQTVFADTTGKEVSVATETIARQVPSKLSLMPANFPELLDEAQFRDLLAYLLSLRAAE